MAEEPKEETQEPTDLRSAIEAAMEPEEPEKAPETSSSAQVEPTEPEPEVPPPALPPDEGEHGSVETAETPPSAETTDPIDPPEHWSLDHQKMFRELAPDAQSFLMDRSKDMEAAHTKRSQEIAPLRNATEKWTPYLSQLQAEPSQVFEALMQHEYGLRTGTNEQKMNILLGLARDYGVDFSRNGGDAAPSAEEDPFGIHSKIQAAVNPLAEQVQSLTGNFQSQTANDQQSRLAAKEREIEEFRTSTGADGKAAHPYYAEVQNDMLAAAQAKSASGQPLDIAELYEAACWSNPSVRAKLQAADNHTAQLAQRKAEQGRATRAKTAAGSLAGGGGSSTEQPKDRRAAITAAFDAVGV